MSSDVGWHIRDKLRPMPKRGSVWLYVHGNPQKVLRTDSSGRPPRLSHSSWTMSGAEKGELQLQRKNKNTDSFPSRLYMYAYRTRVQCETVVPQNYCCQYYLVYYLVYFIIDLATTTTKLYIYITCFWLGIAQSCSDLCNLRLWLRWLQWWPWRESESGPRSGSTTSATFTRSSRTRTATGGSASRGRSTTSGGESVRKMPSPSCRQCKDRGVWTTRAEESS